MLLLLVRECLVSDDGVIREVIDKFGTGNEIPEELKFMEFWVSHFFSLRKYLKILRGWKEDWGA